MMLTALTRVGPPLAGVGAVLFSCVTREAEMSDDTNEAEIAKAREFVIKHMSELNNLILLGHEGKRVVGLVAMVAYEDGTVYPHATGRYPAAKTERLCSFLMGADMIRSWEAWCARAKEQVDGDSAYSVWHEDPQARRILEGGL